MAAAKSVQDLKAEAEKQLRKRPDHFPAVCDAAPDSNLPPLEKPRKLLVPLKLDGSALYAAIKDSLRKVNGAKEQAEQLGETLELTVGESRYAVRGTDSMTEVYHKHKSVDLMLYIYYGPRAREAEPEPQLEAPAAAEPSRPSCEAPKLQFSPPVRVSTAQFCEEVRRMQVKYPHHVPVCCRAAEDLASTLKLHKKMVVPNEMKTEAFPAVAWKPLEAAARSASCEGIRMLVCNEPIPTGLSMRTFWEQQHAEDGILYVDFTRQAPREVLEPAAEPPTVAAAEPVAEPVAAPVVPAAEPVAEPVAAPVAEPAAEAAAQHDHEHRADSTAEPEEEQATSLGLAEANDWWDEEDGAASESSLGDAAVHLPDNDPDVVQDLSEARCQTMSASTVLSRSSSAAQGVAPAAEEEQAAASEAPASESPAEEPAAASECAMAASSCSTSATEEARQMQRRYPDRVVVFLERAPSSNLPELSIKRFMVPKTMQCSELKYIVHKHIQKALKGQLGAEQTIYLFVGSITPKGSDTIAELHDRYAAATSGVLHVRYAAEATLGY